METGKVEYAPDYKSEKRKPLNPRVNISANGRPFVAKEDVIKSMLGNKSADIESELARLQAAVLKIVTAYRAAVKAYIAPHSRIYSQDDLWSAVDALIAFEAEHAIGEG